VGPIEAIMGGNGDCVRNERGQPYSGQGGLLDARTARAQRRRRAGLASGPLRAMATTKKRGDEDEQKKRPTDTRR